MVSKSSSFPSSSEEGDASHSSIRTEPLYVLYGSQTGNSEQAAEDFCKQLKEKFIPSYFRQHDLTPVNVETTCIQLDDFLDYHHAAFSKILVIFVSSYGVGQAPIGAYKFRSFADELLSLVKTNEGGDYASLLKGLRYAICGLGTFLLNIIDFFPTYSYLLCLVVSILSNNDFPFSDLFRFPDQVILRIQHI